MPCGFVLAINCQVDLYCFCPKAFIDLMSQYDIDGYTILKKLPYVCAVDLGRIFIPYGSCKVVTRLGRDYLVQL